MAGRYATLCIAAAYALSCAASAAAAEGRAMAQDDVEREYQEMIEPAMDFLHLVNTRFPGRECVRDRSLLNADYDVIALSLLRMFLVRGDLRQDVRELFMRLATFQALAPEERHLARPLAIPPRTHEEQQRNAAVVQARIAFWSRLDELEAQYPASEEELRPDREGFLITTEDRGWRPEAPTNVLREPDSCRTL